MNNINIDIQFLKEDMVWRVRVVGENFVSVSTFSDHPLAGRSAFEHAIDYAQEALNDARDRQTSQRAEDITDSVLKPLLEGLDLNK